MQQGARDLDSKDAKGVDQHLSLSSDSHMSIITHRSPHIHTHYTFPYTTLNIHKYKNEL